MTHSEAFLAAKYGGFHTAFTNDYLLKHGNFFMKPTLHADGFVYPAISEAARYRIFKDVKCEVLDHPLNFAIKQEKPPTPPASASPSPSKSPPSPSDPRASPTILNGQSKNATWILGTQKLSWDESTVASYNPDTKMFRCVVCNAVGFLSRIAEHYLGTHTSAKVFQCLHCPYSSTWSRCVRMHMAKHHGVPNAPPSLWKGQPLLEEIFQLLTSLKTSVDSQGRERLDPELCDKKFVCPKCPYTTDRRDLYLRHENIHKEDKPYHCYVCFKLFNRADHVKKHFLRIHRGHPYDISLVRRRPPRVSSSSSTTNNNGASQVSSSKSNNFSVDKLIANDKPPKVEVEVEIEEDAMDLSRSSDPSKQQLRTFQCPSCEWEGVDSWCLRRHMNVHLKSFECPICDFKAGKAERLFTHVYRAHKKLVCTKCKFMTDLAQDFEVHIKECCVEIVVGNVFDKISEDCHNSSDDAADFKFDSSLGIPFGKLFDPPSNRMDLKGSVSLIPLHNSISYCYPATTAQGLCPDDLGNLSGLNGKDLGNLSRLNGNVNGLNEKYLGNLSRLNGNVNGLNGKDLGNISVMNGKVNGLNGSVYGMPNFGMNGDGKPNTEKQCKVNVKTELASPVQSSSDSGVTDLTADTVPVDDIACWHCGCEFADLSSLHTHTELHHGENDDPHSAPPTTKTKSSSSSRAKKFSCAVCNFRSDSQRTIIEHMRFHTGELVPCGACDFRTACDSALERHVLERHADGEKRCPHCGFLCVQKVPFIRHYRKCHHSKSCSRCRVIKRSLDPKLADDLSLLLETSKKRGCSDVVRPYLHHNPYSKKSNAITPYSHCNAAMSKVAVAIPPSLQRTATDDELVATSADDSTIIQQRKSSRKQTSPRKLLHHAKQGQISPRKSPSKMDSKIQQDRNVRRAIHQDRNAIHQDRNAIHQDRNAIHQDRNARNDMHRNRNSRNANPHGRNAVCDSSDQRQTSPRKLVSRRGRIDTICDTNRRRKTPSESHIRKKLLNKFAKVPSSNRRCVMGHGRVLAFRSGVNYVRHLYWCHHARRFRCHLCNGRFCHEYQVLLHRRSVHE